MCEVSLGHLPLRKRCFLLLSPGGGDAEVIREFDTDKKAFVADGFELPEANSSMTWNDENTVYVGTDFGASSLTKSGYPRFSKEWQRGAAIASATTIIEARFGDDGVTCDRDFVHEPNRDVCTQEMDCKQHEVTLLVDGKWSKIDVWMWLEGLPIPSTLIARSYESQTMAKQSPSFFDAATMGVKQQFATSKDGTKIPYFEIAKKNRAGPVPTIIRAYGGFDISINANYVAKLGSAWVDRGGGYGQANLRGGGEYGPAWHEAVMKRKRLTTTWPPCPETS